MLSARRGRLLAKVDKWTEAMAADFATECAWHSRNWMMHRVNLAPARGANDQLQRVDSSILRPIGAQLHPAPFGAGICGWLKGRPQCSCREDVRCPMGAGTRLPGSGMTREEVP